MEKVIWCLGGPEEDGPDLGPAVLARAEDLRAQGVRDLRINVVDDHVAPAAPLRIRTAATPVLAVVSGWVDSAIEERRAPLDGVLATLAPSVAAYLVTESVPLVGATTPLDATGRVEGLAQIALLHRRPGLDDASLDDLWLERHTAVALATQSTLSYVQNRVARVLTPGAEAWDAIVEEVFPPEAMTDPDVFFDGRGDPDRCAQNQRDLFASVERFVDLARIEVLATSRHVLA